MILGNSNFDAVIPAKAGIQLILGLLDTRFREYDVKMAFRIGQGNKSTGDLSRLLIRKAE